MKKIQYIGLVIVIWLTSVAVYAQYQIKEGSNPIPYKKVTFGNINCEISPTVVYQAQEPGRLSISFTANWTNKGGDIIDDGENNLLLFEEYEKFRAFYKQKDKEPVLIPKFIYVKSEDFKSIKLTANDRAIKPKPLPRGFLLFNDKTDNPIIIEGIEPATSTVKISFQFIYVMDDGKKIAVDGVASTIEWVFKMTEISAKGTDCLALQKKYNEKVDSISSKSNRAEIAVTLKNEILQNPDFGYCPTERNAIIARLDALINQITESAKSFEPVVTKKPIEKAEVKITEQEKVQPKVIPQKSKAEQWDKLRSEYDQSLNKIEQDFTALSNRSKEMKESLNQRIEKNTVDIDSLQEIFKNNPVPSPELLNSLKPKYNSIKESYDWIKNEVSILMNQLSDFKNEITNKKYLCRDDFMKVDNAEGPQRAKTYMDRLDRVISQVAGMERSLQDINEKIKNNEVQIIALFGYFDKGKMLSVSYIRTRYDSLFSVYYDNLIEKEGKFDSLRQEFENIRYSKSYYDFKKKNLISRVDELKEIVLQLKLQDSLSKIQKNEELAKYDFVSDFEAERNFDKVISSLDFDFLRTQISESPTHKFPYVYLIILIIIASILLFGARTYYKALQLRKVRSRSSQPNISLKDDDEKPASGGITITQTISKTEKGKGLLDVRKKAGIDFLELDLNQEWGDTVVRKLFFSRDCIIETYRFFEDSIHGTDTNSTANETGGYLIGRWDTNPDDNEKMDISLEDFLEPGDDASFSRYQLNFGSKIGIRLQKTLDNYRQKMNKDLVLTGWFHSHPGLKIFLSDFDISVQKGFLSSTDGKLRMVALVIDPYTKDWDVGIFTFKSDGTMNNAEDSRQFFSLEDMYNWARSSAGSPEGYFNIKVSGDLLDTIVNNVYFSNPCILEIKRCIEDYPVNQKDNILGFFTGDKMLDGHGNFDLVFRGLQTYDETIQHVQVEGVRLLGCLYRNSGPLNDVQKIVTHPGIVLNNLPLILVYNMEENNFVTITHNKEGTFNRFYEDAEKIDFSDLVSWTRKRK